MLAYFKHHHVWTHLYMYKIIFSLVKTICCTEHCYKELRSPQDLICPPPIPASRKTWKQHRVAYQVGSFLPHLLWLQAFTYWMTWATTRYTWARTRALIITVLIYKRMWCALSAFGAKALTQILSMLSHSIQNLSKSPLTLFFCKTCSALLTLFRAWTLVDPFSFGWKQNETMFTAQQTNNLLEMKQFIPFICKFDYFKWIQAVKH